MESTSARRAGYLCHSPPALRPHTEKPAPTIGPNRKPRLKATPMSAMPRPRVAGLDTSVTIAVLKLTFPLLIPPMTLAKTNTAKFVLSAHNR